MDRHKFAYRTVRKFLYLFCTALNDAVNLCYNDYSLEDFLRAIIML